jgi:hypothetical protein
MSNRAYKYMVPNGYKDHESSSESSGEETLVSSKVMFETNGHVESNDDSDNDNENEQKYLKRAGVAYVSKSGQIVVLPEYDKVRKEVCSEHPSSSYILLNRTTYLAHYY